MSGPTQQRFYQFGPFRLDVGDRVLTREQQVIPLNLKTFEILLALVENAGKVVTKDVLMKKVWPDSFVEEGNLTKGIFVLRKALGDRPSGGPWIETFPKRGYRFTVEPAASSDFGKGEIVLPKVHFPAHLPAPRNSFVGRQEDLSCLRERLLHQSVRLLTITGPGGTGKTRLALELARTLQSVFAGGIHFVGLSSLPESSDVIPVIAKSFGFSNPGGKFGGDVLRDQLEVSLTAPTLLVLDNFEHLLASAGIVASLLDGCHLLKILVTSRAVLRVYGENEYVLLPLPLPDAEHLPELRRLSSNPAVALFLHRVGSVKPDFALMAENACDVAGICTRLDGLPLAIELAAARMKMLSAADLLQRLQARLQVLTGGPLDAPERQQTLRQTIDWSYGLLNESQQKLFRRVSAFLGGFTAESAEAVCNARVDIETDTLEATRSLLDHSLVLRIEGVQDQIRFTMLETVREYALERLTLSGEEEFTRWAHAAYCLVIAEEGNAKAVPADRESWLTTCDAEHHNLRAALAWLIEKQQSEWALRMAVALFAFWESREHLAEGCQSLNAALLLPASAVRTRLRAGALWRLGALVGFSGDFKQSMQLHGEALDIYLEVGTREDIAFEFAAIGAGRMLLGEYEQAESWYRQSLALYRELGSQTEIAQTMSNLAQAQNAQGNHESARSLLHDALTIFRELGEWSKVGWSLNHLGDVCRSIGDRKEALRLYHEAANIFQQQQDRWGIARCFADLGDLSSEQGEYSTAHALFRQALELFLKLGHKRGVARTFEQFAVNAARHGFEERAVRLAGCAAGLRHRTNASTRPCDKPGLDRALEAAWEGVDSETAREAWTSGWGMPLDEAVLYTVSQDDS